MGGPIVLFKTTLIQVWLYAPVKNAFELRSSLVGAIIMNLHMLLEIAGWRESLPAVFTLKGLLPGVNPLVPYQVWHLAKPQTTPLYLTHEGLLLVVNSGVLLEWRVLSEILIALSTKGSMNIRESKESGLNYFLLGLIILNLGKSIVTYHL